jgi:choline transporter-like protein 2/4/5
MGVCCCGSGSSDDEPDKKGYDPSHSGPAKERHCTDIICLILLAIFLAGWGFIAIYAFLNGNLAQLIYPSNSAGWSMQ